MKIAIDARLYGPAKNKGLGRYVEQLVKNLEVIDPAPEQSSVQGKSNDYFILLRKENWNEYNPKNSGFKKVLADYRWYSLAEQIFLPFTLWRLKVDLVHFPHFNAPIFYFGRFVATIHDLIMYKFPDERATTKNKLIYKIKYWLHKIVVKSAVRRAEKIFAVSEWTKKDIVSEFRVDQEKVIVTHLGFETGDVNKVVNAIVNKVNNTNIFSKYNITKPYLLYAGNAYPHKNLRRLILAFGLVRERFTGLQLVLVGKSDYFYNQLISNIKYPISGIIFTDYISNNELAELYRNATAYIFPSLYEGFGLPGLEAMSYGAPVVSSNASCLPEIYGEAALYFDPTDLEDMSKKIMMILENEDLRKDLASKGFEQAKKYSWERCTRQTLDIYTHLLNGNRVI